MSATTPGTDFAAPLLPTVPAIPKPTNLLGLPGATGGVALNPPPVSLLGSVGKAVSDACATIPDDKHIALVAIATKTQDGVNVNLAAVQRLGKSGDFAVMEWFGASWGQGKPGYEVGAAVRWVR